MPVHERDRALQASGRLDLRRKPRVRGGPIPQPRSQESSAKSRASSSPPTWPWSRKRSICHRTQPRVRACSDLRGPSDTQCRAVSLFLGWSGTWSGVTRRDSVARRSSMDGSPASASPVPSGKISWMSLRSKIAFWLNWRPIGPETEESSASRKGYRRLERNDGGESGFFLMKLQRLPASRTSKARSHSAPYVRSYNSESMLQKPCVITRTGHPSASSQ